MKRRATEHRTSESRSSAQTAPASSVDPSEKSIGLSIWAQIALSMVLVLHLSAVVLGPLRFATGDSPAVRPVARLFDPYMSLLYLDHGYAFFAPDPGPNHLVQCEMKFPPGRESLVAEFPNRETDWPRLLYHRHFMLAEELNRLAPLPLPPPPRSPADKSPAARRVFDRQQQAWAIELERRTLQRKNYERMQNSIINHLKFDYEAAEIVLVRRQHRPLELDEFTEYRLKPQDASTYFNLPETPVAEELPWIDPPTR